MEIYLKKEKTEYTNNKLNILPIQGQLSKLVLKRTQMDFDATSFYPPAMWNNDSVYPKVESGYTFTPHMNMINWK